MQKIRGILTASLIIVLLCTLVLAQNSSNISSQFNSKDPTPKLDDKVEKEIAIPEKLQTLTKIGLGINPQEKIKVSRLITIIALWILVFIISLSGLKAIPVLGQIGSFVSAIVITMLIGSTKALSLATDQWLDNEKLFIFIDGWSFGNLVIKLIIILALIIVALYLSKKIKKEVTEDKKERMLNKIKIWFSSLRSKN